MTKTQAVEIAANNFRVQVAKNGEATKEMAYDAIAFATGNTDHGFTISAEEVLTAAKKMGACR